MRPIGETTNNVLIELLKGTFRKPVKDRTKVEKNAVILFWRRKYDLSLKMINGENVLFSNGKRVLTVEALGHRVKKAEQKARGGGARTIAHSLKHKYVGVSERVVSNIMSKSKQHGHLTAKFTNKPPLKSIRSSYVFERVQIDLLRMTDINYQEHTYRFILTVVDTFSRYDNTVLQTSSK